MPASPDDRPLPWLRLLTDTPPAPATHVQGRACRSRTGLFTEWASQLRFPEYFGHNWDALADCLTDRVDEAPLTLVVDDAAGLLADEPAGQLTILLTVLRDLAETRPGRLEVILRCEPVDQDRLCRRVSAADPRG
jgi:RNAse (barnase) inhibitor barstar